MPITETLHLALQQGGYHPQPSGDAVTFRYYGQPAQVRARRSGVSALLELTCDLPRPLPEGDLRSDFEGEYPLARLESGGGGLRLRLHTLGEADALAPLLALLDECASMLMLGRQAAAPSVRPLGTAHEPLPARELPAVPPPPAIQVPQAVPAPAAAQDSVANPMANTEERPANVLGPVVTPEAPAVPPEPAAPSPPAPERAAAPAAEPLSPGWSELLTFMSGHYHALVRTHAALGLPVPDDVQVDMLVGQQVRGTAILMWGAPPNAVVVCEQGQLVPEGYQGGTWYKHMSERQVADETRAHLLAAGRLR